MVVDLDEVRGAVCVSLEVDLPGVVAAGRDAVELGKCDVGQCHCRDTFCFPLLRPVYTLNLKRFHHHAKFPLALGELGVRGCILGRET